MTVPSWSWFPRRGVAVAIVAWQLLPAAPSASGQPSVNTADRGAVAAFYNAVLVSALAVPAEWTGDAATCVPGTTSAAYTDATIDAVNFFRAMTGLPAVAHVPSLDAAAQAAALISTANNWLSHVPTESAKCYSVLGREGASRSNLSLGTAGAEAVLSYMDDSGPDNLAVGHRRWILHPAVGGVGTGSTSNANALYVMGSFAVRPATPSVVAWPSAGYVPAPLVYSRWSFSLNTGAPVDYSSARVTMTRGGVSIPVSVLPDYKGFGDDTLVWWPELTFTPGSPDQVIEVSIRHVLVNGQPRMCSYKVAIFDPAVPGSGSLSNALPGCTNDTAPPADPGTEPAVDPGTGTVSWASETSGSWHVASNWSTGQVPGPNDDVIVHKPGVALTVSVTSPVTVRSLKTTEALSIAGTLTVNELAQLYGPVSMNAGALAGPGMVTIHGTMRWSGGSMTGVGDTAVAAGGTLIVDAPSNQIIGITERSLTNRGTLVWRGGYINYSNGASLTNTATGLWLVEGHRSSQDSGTGAPSRVTNAGILQKTGEPAGVYFASLTFWNTGTIRLRHAAGTHYDYVSAGNAIAGGSLEVEYIDGYLPANGEGFHAVICSGSSGTFASVSSPTRLVPDYWSQGITLYRRDACEVTLSSHVATAPASGALQSIGLTASGTSCGWMASSDQPWLLPKPGSGYAGSHTLGYVVQPNPTTSPRTAVLTVDGQALTVTQAAAACSATLSTDLLAAPSAGSTLSVDVAASAPACVWDATSNQSWLVPETSGSTGSTTLKLLAQPNPLTHARIATVTIAGQVLTVRQVAASTPSATCGVTLWPTSTTITLASATSEWANVIASSESCLWTVSSNVSWLVPSSTTQTGSQFLSYQVQANPTAHSRTGTMTIGDQTLTVLQPGKAAPPVPPANPEPVPPDTAPPTPVPPGPIFTRYLAEGATSSFFDTRIAVLNPGTAIAQATVTFLRGSASPLSYSVAVPPGRRLTIDPKFLAGLQAAEFSTVVESSQPLVIDRTMTWGDGYGSHSETAVDAPSPIWYFAEGATISGFQLFYLIQNPSTHDVPVRVRYLRTAGTPLEKTYMVPAQSRFNIWANGEEFAGAGPALASAEFSAVAEALDGTPIIVERAMYLNAQNRTFNAGHESAGVTAPARRWFLAEGATGSYFDLFVLIANPTDTDAEVKLTYLLTNGRTLTRTMTAPANARSGVWVDMETFDGIAGYPLADVAVSTTVESLNDVPLVVERSMWWPGDGSTWHEAHNSAGSTTTGTRWAVAEGEVGGTRQQETYLLIANTSSYDGNARVTLYFEDGSSAWRDYPLAPQSRTNVNAAADFGDLVKNKRFGAVVESLGATPAQIVVERAMYSNAGGVRWAAGTNALAARVP